MHSDELRELFTLIKNKRILFVGLGNYNRGDDAVGLYMVNNLKKKCKKKISHI